MTDGNRKPSADTALALSIEPSAWPSLIVAQGPRAEERFLEFFTAQIRNRNTREAYFRAVSRFFNWCQGRGLALDDIRPVHVAIYIESFTVGLSDPSVKQHLAAI